MKSKNVNERQRLLGTTVANRTPKLYLPFRFTTDGAYEVHSKEGSNDK